MKTKRGKSFFYLSILFYAICYSFNINAQIIQDERIWESINAVEQIPENSLTKMPTEQLIQKYLNSRYSYYIFMYPQDINYAFEKAYKDFNGLRELLNRPDAAKRLIEIYQRMDPSAFQENWTLVNKGQFAFNFVFVEILLAQGRILNSFTESGTKTVLAQLLKKNELKVVRPEMYSTFDIRFNAYSIAKLLESKGKNNGIFEALSKTPGMNDFLNRGILLNKEVLPTVIQKAKEFLNAN